MIPLMMIGNIRGYPYVTCSWKNQATKYIHGDEMILELIQVNPKSREEQEWIE